MKKTSIAVALTAMILSSASATAYKDAVPNGGESFYELSSPTALTSGASVTGGAIFAAGSESLIANPALISKEQRVKINLADTVLFSTNKAGGGDAFQLGLIIPTKMFVIGSYFNGTFVSGVDAMGIGNSLTLKGALAKDITDKLAIGLGVSTGVNWNNGADWALNGNLGFVYNHGALGPIKDFRYGASIMNLGKNFGSNEDYFFGYPCFATVKAGAAGSFLKNDIVNLGFAADLTTPCFQNLNLDLGLKMAVKDMLVIGVCEKINLVETIRAANNSSYAHPSFIPSVSLSFKFSFDVKAKDTDDEKSLAVLMEKHDWSESELNVSAGWKQLYTSTKNDVDGSLQAASVGVDLSLGMKDTTEPVINIWFDELDEE